MWILVCGGKDCCHVLADETEAGPYVADLKRQLASCTDECNRNGEALVESIRESADMLVALEGAESALWLMVATLPVGPLRIDAATKHAAVRAAIQKARGK